MLAFRFALLVEHLEVWKAASKTPPGSHIGVHASTGGFMLGNFALSNPLSSQAQEAKQGLARVPRMPLLSQRRDDPLPTPIYPFSQTALTSTLQHL